MSAPPRSNFESVLQDRTQALVSVKPDDFSFTEKIIALVVAIGDDETIRELIAAALRFEGYEVLKANNGVAP